jgi:hypothetical protein
MKAIMTLAAAVLLASCTIPNWPGARGGYGYPGNYGYGYPPGYGNYNYGGYGYPGSGYYGGGPVLNDYYYGYNRAREEDWRRWQAYQYGLSQGKQQARQPQRGGRLQGGGANRDANEPKKPPQLPYGITRNRGGTYHVPGYGDFTAGQIQNYARRKRR